MAQIIGQLDQGYNIGSGVGQGISAGLQQLAQQKMQDITQQKEMKRNVQYLKDAFPDIPEEALHFLASKPPKEQLEYVTLISQGMQGQLEQQQQQRGEQENGLQALLGQQQEMQQRPQAPYAPGFQGQKQAQYGGQEQQQVAQQIKQAQQQLAQPKEKPSLSKSLGQSGNQKVDDKQQKQVEAKKHVQKAYDRVKEILDTGYTGYSLTGWTPEGRKLRSELDTLSEVFISNLIPLLNPKGTMSKERFNYIKNLAPNSWDTDSALKGKLAALRDIFELEGSSPEKSSNGTIEMRDDSGNVYDIPKDQVEKAKKAGLK